MEIGGDFERSAKPCSAFPRVIASLGRINRPFQRFYSDTRGDVAMLFGLMALALFMMIGLALTIIPIYWPRGLWGRKEF